MTPKMRAYVRGLLLGLPGTPLLLWGVQSLGGLFSSDGYTLTDANGLYLVPKESE